MKGYSTGGKHEPKGDYGHNSGGNSVNVSMSGAGMGTHSSVNTKDDSKPGGKGSRGTKSKSSPA